MGAHNGSVRMHIECPKNTKFMIPLAWTTTLTGEQGETVREVVSSRYMNVNPIGEDNYLPCCGAINGQGPEGNKGHIKGCYKNEIAIKKARMAAAVVARPEIVAPPMFIKIARKDYINYVKKAIVPLINNCKLTITNEMGETKTYPAIPTECKAWSALAGHKRKATGQCQPGQFCNHNCKLLPCVAIRHGMKEEYVAREMYAAAVML